MVVSKEFFLEVQGPIKNFANVKMSAALIGLGFNPVPVQLAENVIVHDLEAVGLIRGLYWGPMYFQNGVLKDPAELRNISDLIAKPWLGRDVKPRVQQLLRRTLQDLPVEYAEQYRHPYTQLENNVGSALFGILGGLSRSLKPGGGTQDRYYRPGNREYHDFLDEVLANIASTK